MRISSIKTIMNKFRYFLNTLLFKSMKVAEVLVNPNEINTN